MTKEQIAAFKVDKSNWPRGEWDNEPDRVDFRHAGLPCMMIRNFRLGHWCGYAGVPPTHPLFGKDYNEVEVEAHGGLTYADHCEGHICHVPELGESDEVFWFGFDCGHSGDIVPYTAKFEGLRDYGAYRNAAYVRHEVERLAEQLAEVA